MNHRESGGVLVIDAMDLLVEPTVWSSLKRMLRHRQVEIQSYDPSFMMAGVSLKPEPVPIDVKVVMIGTPQIYRLHAGHTRRLSVKINLPGPLPQAPAPDQRTATPWAWPTASWVCTTCRSCISAR